MLFLTAVTLGLSASLLRSAFAMALVAVLIIASFAAAAFAGPVSFIDLAEALAGYNIGIFGLVAGMLVFGRRKAEA